MKLKAIHILIFLLLLSHIPFLTADPDQLVDVHTRGAWTDEGLYSAQARNFVNYGDFGLEENTTFVRGPLFNVLQVPVFFLFGSSLPVARLITIIIICMAFYFLGSFNKSGIFAVFLLLLGFTHFRVFNFSHYAMAEMISIAMVMLGFTFLSKYFIDHNRKNLLFSVLMIFISYSLKIQFLYLIILMPAVVIVFNFMRIIKGSISRKIFFTDLLFVSGYTVLFALLYFLLWYLPNKSFYDAIMLEQSDGRFDISERILQTISFNFDTYILKPENYPLIIGFVAGMIFWILSFFVRSIKIKNQLVVIFGFFWILAELHKLPMIYLPQRYLLGLYVAIAFFVAAIFYQLFEQNKVYKFILISGLALTLIVNMIFNFGAYQRRTYEIEKANNYLSNYNWEGKTIAGVWGPTISWGTKAKIVPVWQGFTQGDNFFTKVNPELIVAEFNESESDGFYLKNGFDLAALSDSTRNFKMWRYDLNLFWMDPSKISGK